MSIAGLVQTVALASGVKTSSVWSAALPTLNIVGPSAALALVRPLSVLMGLVSVLPRPAGTCCALTAHVLTAIIPRLVAQHASHAQRLTHFAIKGNVSSALSIRTVVRENGASITSVVNVVSIPSIAACIARYAQFGSPNAPKMVVIAWQTLVVLGGYAPTVVAVGVIPRWLAAQSASPAHMKPPIALMEMNAFSAFPRATVHKGTFATAITHVSIIARP